MLCFPSTFLWNICALQLDSRPVINEEDGEDTDDEEEDDSDNEADEEIPAVLKGSTSSIALGEENSTIMVSWSLWIGYLYF